MSAGWYAQSLLEVKGMLDRMAETPTGSIVVRAGSSEQAALVALLEGAAHVYWAGRHTEQALHQLAALEGPV